jgi:hypothetical protein
MRKLDKSKGSQPELPPIDETQKKKALKWLRRQTPRFIGCLSGFQLDTFIVIEMNVVINDLPSFIKAWGRKLAEGFFFQVSKEVFHRGIVPAVA